MHPTVHASRGVGHVVASRHVADAACPAITGDIPKIIANEDRLYEGDLVAYFKVLFFKAQNLSNPYHNLRHILHVTWLCHKAIELYRGELSPRKARNLLIAALFHDFDHLGHCRPVDADRLNIELAVAALRRHVQPADREALPEIELLIRATEYPYTRPAHTLDLAGKIIRDADLAQALNSAWIQQVVIGLAEEAELTPLDMLRAQRSFLGALRFNTAWARRLFPRHVIAAKIDEAETLLRLLEAPETPSGALSIPPSREEIGTAYRADSDNRY